MSCVGLRIAQARAERRVLNIPRRNGLQQQQQVQDGSRLAIAGRIFMLNRFNEVPSRREQWPVLPVCPRQFVENSKIYGHPLPEVYATSMFGFAIE